MAFKIFETEDEFNAAFKDRVDRERAKYAGFDDFKAKAEKYDELIKANWEAKAKKAEKDYNDLIDKYKDYDGNLAKEKARADDAEKGLLRIKIADKHNLPMSIADRITGNDENEMDKDAEALAKLFSGGGTLPRYNADPVDDRNSKRAAEDAALLQVVKNLNHND